uniref:Brain protein 44 n=1 Tax=Anoplopoma fimbria TaxID=229290 RepID=C3KIU0_ANOFI|nr:Brain protein 44 [Anoplopoma fimbria]
MAALRASYHRILDKIEHMLPGKLRPLYNHPAGNVECQQPGSVCVMRIHPAVWWKRSNSSSCLF